MAYPSRSFPHVYTQDVKTGLLLDPRPGSIVTLRSPPAYGVVTVGWLLPPPVCGGDAGTAERISLENVAVSCFLLSVIGAWAST